MFLSTLETLPDEILMIIFQYADDIYLLFRTFFGLNQRLNNILLDKRSHLFTDFLQIYKHDQNFHYYYNSLVFKTISQQISSMNVPNQLHRCFQSLIIFHIREQYIQMKYQVELQIEKFKSIRQCLTDEQILNIDKELKKSFENLRKPIQNSIIKQIESLVYNQGACLEYNDHEQAGFYFAEDFRHLFIDDILSLPIIRIFKTLFISNPYLLKYPCYGGGYRFSIYEFLLYYYYYNSFDRKSYRALIDLILFTTQCLKYLSDGENWIEKIILVILDVLSKSRLIKENEIFIQTTQLEIFQILLDEYMLLPIIKRYDENLTDRFRFILEGLMKINRFDVILRIYRHYKPVRNFFNNRMNIRKNVNMMTENRIRRQFFSKLIDVKPLENWLINEDLIFILLEKKERKLLEKLLKSSLSLIHQLDQYGNTLLLYTCLKVSGSRHRIIEFLIKMGCDLQRRNLKGDHFNDALQLPKNRRLLRNLIERKSIKIDHVSEQILVTIEK